MAEQTLFKNELGKNSVIQLAHLLTLTVPGFSSDAFQKQALTGLDQLELKQRVSHLIHVLHEHFPTEFDEAIEVLLAIKYHWNNDDRAETWGSFTAWPLIDYVAEYGTKYPEIAVTTLKALTPLFSAEFAIRTFIDQHFDLTYPQLLLWAEDHDEHVRRLACEGIRPRLPWGKQLSQFCDDPAVIFPILEKLKDDPSLYVRKSVANNLNDISKDNPDQVIDLCRRWYTDSSTDRLWIIRHALRSLIKGGHPDVFPLLGYSEKPQLSLQAITVANNTLKLGEHAEVSVGLLSKSSEIQKLVVDYKIHHVKANGKLTAKVFKWKNITLQPEQQLTLIKKHPFKEISTRKYYSGQHKIELLINGVVYGGTEFNLVV